MPMGQIIDFHQRRVRQQPVSPASATRATVWPLAQADSVAPVMAPMVELWRSILATYAAFWFAPLGLEVRAVESRKDQEEGARATSRR
jgi:hypothetical protein